MKRILNIVFLLLSVISIGQENQFFSEISATYKVKETYNWLYKATPYWKHIYDEVGWRRIGFNFEADRKLSVWTLMGGVENSYTFNPEIENYFELRPWLGVGLKTQISNRFAFRQQLKGEWRNLIFSSDYEYEKKDRSYGRARYLIGFDILMAENLVKNNDLNLSIYNEWFYLKSASTGESFANSRLFGFKLGYDFSKERRIILGYKVENFLANSNTPDRKGHTVFVEYIF